MSGYIGSQEQYHDTEITEGPELPATPAWPSTALTEFKYTKNSQQKKRYALETVSTRPYRIDVDGVNFGAHQHTIDSTLL
jgi:hypothetical protein